MVADLVYWQHVRDEYASETRRITGTSRLDANADDGTPFSNFHLLLAESSQCVVPQNVTVRYDLLTRGSHFRLCFGASDGSSEIVSLTSDDKLSYISFRTAGQRRQVDRVVDAASARMHTFVKERSCGHQTDPSSTMSSLPCWSNDESENNTDNAREERNDATDLHLAAGSHSSAKRDGFDDMTRMESGVEALARQSLIACTRRKCCLQYVYVIKRRYTNEAMT